MILCPVCEHQQAQGSECEQCGKALVVTAVAPVAVQRLAELEGNPIAGGEAARAAPVQQIADLEVNRILSGPDLPAMAVPDLERAQVAPVGAVQVEAMADLDLGREKDLDPRTAAPAGAMTCRYCRNVQASGLFCDKCGMRLPRTQAPAGAAAAGPKKFVQTVWTRCKSCGAPAKAGEKCGDCGRDVPFPEP
ncbi:MAG: hypothetical protein ACYC8T_07820 [Myxococcaceae bacterium]